jgi:hypothetical protein
LKLENYAQIPLLHFLTRLPQRRKNYPQNLCFIFKRGCLRDAKTILGSSLLDHGFQEDNAPEGHHVKGQNLIMASKRSSLEGINTLYKDTMLRVVTGVKRSGSNNPIEEITMSTTGSKSSEVEIMGDNAT